MKTYVTLCLTLPLRDFAAFEDLAEELGVKIKNVEVAPEVQIPVPATKVVKGRASPVRVNLEMYKAAMSYPESMSHRAVRRNMLRTFEKLPAVSTIGRIRSGDYPYPVKKEYEEWLLNN